MEFFKCPKCEKIFFSDSTGEDCFHGENLEKIIANSSNASAAKHTPSVHIEDECVIVFIGEEEHPMTKDHKIDWVAAEYKDSYIRYNLHENEKPEVYFDYEEGMTIYVYCNQHGLWSKKI